VLAFGVIPACALLLALGAGFLKCRTGRRASADLARTASVEVARQFHIAMLSTTRHRAQQLAPPETSSLVRFAIHTHR